MRLFRLRNLEVRPQFAVSPTRILLAYHCRTQLPTNQVATLNGIYEHPESHGLQVRIRLRDPLSNK